MAATVYSAQYLHKQGVRRRFYSAFVLISCLLGGLLAPAAAGAIGEASFFDVRVVDYGGRGAARASAPRRLAWEVRKRTSVETVLSPSRARLDDPEIFSTPFLYWSGDAAFPPLGDAELTGLRRFVELGGFLLIDDASSGGDAFDVSVRRELTRAFGGGALRPLPPEHTLYRAFYLVDRPVGRRDAPAFVEGVERGGRIAVVYSRHDLGGAWARDTLGNWEHVVTPGGEGQREMAIRFGVNIVLYALCLDYKDDQVHAPFIMRRRAR